MVVDTATHVDNEGDYWCMGNDDEPSFFNSIDEVWDYCETEAPLRKLSDIKTLCAQYERIAELEMHIQSLKVINEYIGGGCPNIQVVRSEIGEVISRAEGTYLKAPKEQGE